MRRKIGAVAAAIAVLALAACDTQPATDVTSRGATLNSKGACASGTYGGTNQYQLRNYSANGAWSDVGPRYRFDCTGATQEVALNSYHVTGLTENTTYQFRLVSRLDNGSVQTWDATGTNGGGLYDSFRTKADRDWSIQCAQNPALPDCGGMYSEEDGTDGGAVTAECDTPGVTACASGAQKKCKGRNGNPLTNIYRYYDYWIKSREAKVDTDWCWKNGKIVERHSVPSALVTGWGGDLGWYVNRSDDRTAWKYSACSADMSTCLTRYQVAYSCCYDDATPIPILTVTICIATRIYAGPIGPPGQEYHSRRILRGSCPS
jgi:hypothetical protein